MSKVAGAQGSLEEKSPIVLEALRSGDITETCRKYETTLNPYCRRKGEVEAGAKAAHGGEKRCRMTRCPAAAAGPGAGTGPLGRRWNAERLIAWLHNYRRLFTRWDSHPNNFLAMIQLVCALSLLSHL